MSENSELIPVAEAALLSPPFTTLSYRLPAGFPAGFWSPGLRLAVPLGRGLRSAVLLGVSQASPGDMAFKLKEIAWPLEHAPLLTPAYLEFARQFALRQALPEGRVLAGMLPAGLREVNLRLRFFVAESDRQDFELREMSNLAAEERVEFAALWAAGLGRVLRQRESAGQELYSLNVSPPWPVRPSAVKQLQLLEFMNGAQQMTRGRILRELGPDFTPVLKQLAVKGLVRLHPLPAGGDTPARLDRERAARDWLERHGQTLRTPPPFALNNEQRAALEDLFTDLTENITGLAAAPRSLPARLLYGVTGSGKTAVYLEFAAKVLLAGRSVLILAPEVALALKLRQDAATRFPGLPIHFYHGYQPQAAREACFRELAKGAGPALVIGTRSALFLELPDPPGIGAIILDEEHDSSFKQDERINYQAKDLAWYRAAQHRAVLVLGSATPDLKTFHAAEQGYIVMHRLGSRVGGGELPEVILSPMYGKRTAGVNGVLTDESAAALKECVGRNEQAVILLNRRGYAPAMYCLGCGVPARCPNCEISLTYHKKREKLVCHYCGYAAPFPSPCAACKSTHFLPLGEGTEKLEERLQSLLPVGSRVLRLDRDSTARPGLMEDILRSFGRREADVLVGTQMLSKGHHFPSVTLAIVADADIGLNMPDYNAAERVFQLLVQASGRAGRGGGGGKVIIQTRDPVHYCWEYVKNNDYEGFYRRELELRRQRRYPPFVRLALVRISFPLGWPDGHRLLADFGQRLKSLGGSLGVTVLGPAPAPQQLRDRKLRFQCLLKAADWQVIRGVFSGAASRLPDNGNFHLSLDIDPASMM